MEKKGSLRDSQTISNGLSIFSQFLAHDMTFESTSKFKGVQDVGTFQNDRTINLDLDCVYGQKTQTFLYDMDDEDKMLLGKCYSDDENTWWDLQRNEQCKAIIPDARNDENIIVSRMQVLFIRFHNQMVDWVRAQGVAKHEVFAEARKLVIWHYHWLIIWEYLKKMLAPEVFNRIMNDGCQYYTVPFQLPLEFTGAAFRVGHSQTREKNRINETTEKTLFQLGFFSQMEEYVDWKYIFNFGCGNVQFAKKIDTKIGASFHNIPFIKSSNKREKSLPIPEFKTRSPLWIAMRRRSRNATRL